MWVAVALAAVAAIQGINKANRVRGAAALQRKIDKVNAHYAELDAMKVEQQGYTEAARYQQVIDSMEADQSVAYASNDVDINFGTAAQVRADTRVAGYLNTLDIKEAAHQKALGYKNETRARNFKSVMNANELEMGANAAQNEGLFNAAQIGASGYSKSQKG